MTKESDPIRIRSYRVKDYNALKTLYKESGWFDPETDAEERLHKQIEQDDKAILLAIQNNHVLGSVTLLQTARLGLFFRLVTADSISAKVIREKLLETGQIIFRKKGYKEVHIIAPEEDTIRQKEYVQNGFRKGKVYRWFWKKIKS